MPTPYSARIFTAGLLLVIPLASAPCLAQTLRPLTLPGSVREDLESLDREVSEEDASSTGSRLLDQLSKPPLGIISDKDSISIKQAVLKPGSEALKKHAILIPACTADVVRALREDAGPTQKKLTILSDDFELVAAAAKDGNQAAQQAIFAAIALDQSTSTRLVDSLTVTDPKIGQRVASDLREIRYLLSEYTGDQLVGALLAQGSIRGAIAGSGDATGAGTGSVGLSAARKGWTLTGLVTVASSIDTLRMRNDL